MSTDSFINYRVADRDLKYYIFDWDDNILHMPTRIHLERRLPDGSWTPHRVSTSVFSIVRNDPENYRPPGNDWQAAFTEFQDNPADPDGNRFLRDTSEAIARVLTNGEQTAPSFRTFHRTIVEGRIFAIVTARGHDPATLREGVRLFIDTVLNRPERRLMLANLRGYIACFDDRHDAGSDAEVLDYYLELNRYHAVTSPHFERRFGTMGQGIQSPEARKQFAVRDFVEHVIHIAARSGIRRPVSVGFSDDDPANVAAVQAFIKAELTRSFPGVKFVVYDTSDPTLENGHKVVVAGQLDLALTTTSSHYGAQTPATSRGR